MAFELRYPDEVSPTVSWLPSRGPTPQGSSYPEHDGIISDVTADGVTHHAYQITNGLIKSFEFAFEFLTPTDKTDFETFRSTVKGESFKLRDPADDTYYLVKFAPGEGFRREWRWAGGPAEPWMVTLVFQQTE